MLVGALNQKKALLEVFSMIVHCIALYNFADCLQHYSGARAELQEPNHDLQALRLVLAVERVAAAPDSALVHPRQVLARAANLLLVVRHPGLVGVFAAACRITNKQILTNHES